jgi:hypothetical protein
MSTAELIKKFEKLSPRGQDLIEKEIQKLLEKERIAPAAKPRAGFGEMKGVFTYIADDFDAPLEDFKDYM